MLIFFVKKCIKLNKNIFEPLKCDILIKGDTA